MQNLLEDDPRAQRESLGGDDDDAAYVDAFFLPGGILDPERDTDGSSQSAVPLVDRALMTGEATAGTTTTQLFAGRRPPSQWEQPPSILDTGVTASPSSSRFMTPAGSWLGPRLRHSSSSSDHSSTTAAVRSFLPPASTFGPATSSDFTSSLPPPPPPPPIQSGLGFATPPLSHRHYSQKNPGTSTPSTEAFVSPINGRSWSASPLVVPPVVPPPPPGFEQHASSLSSCSPLTVPTTVVGSTNLPFVPPPLLHNPRLTTQSPTLNPETDLSAALRLSSPCSLLSPFVVVPEASHHHDQNHVDPLWPTTATSEPLLSGPLPATTETTTTPSLVKVEGTALPVLGEPPRSAVIFQDYCTDDELSFPPLAPLSADTALSAVVVSSAVSLDGSNATDSSRQAMEGAAKSRDPVVVQAPVKESEVSRLHTGLLEQDNNQALGGEHAKGPKASKEEIASEVATPGRRPKTPGKPLPSAKSPARATDHNKKGRAPRGVSFVEGTTPVTNGGASVDARTRSTTDQQQRLHSRNLEARGTENGFGKASAKPSALSVQEDVSEERVSMAQELPHSLDMAVDVFVSTSLFFYEISLSILQWLTLILFPALKQTLFIVAQTAALALKGALLVMLGYYAICEHAMQEVLAKGMLATNSTFIYACFCLTPSIGYLIMQVSDLPQFTPHIISSTILYYLCLKSSFRIATSENKTSKKKVELHLTMEHIRIWILRAFQLLVPIDLLVDGFMQPNTRTMMLSTGDRILMAYVFCVVNKGLFLAPMAWLGGALQILLLHYLPLQQTLSVMSACSVGLASIHMVDKMEQTRHVRQKNVGKMG